MRVDSIKITEIQYMVIFGFRRNCSFFSQKRMTIFFLVDMKAEMVQNKKKRSFDRGWIKDDGKRWFIDNSAIS